MLWHCYLRQAKVYLPTMGEVAKGLYRGVEPVAVVTVTDIPALRQALRETLLRGNPTVPDLPRASQPPAVVLKYAGVKTWGTFERGTLLWRIEKKDSIFQTMTMKKSSDRGWLEDRSAIQKLPPASTIDDVVERMIATLQNAGRSGAASAV